jgi:hypothetical protein
MRSSFGLYSAKPVARRQQWRAGGEAEDGFQELSFHRKSLMGLK